MTRQLRLVGEDDRWAGDPAFLLEVGWLSWLGWVTAAVAAGAADLSSAATALVLPA